MEWYDGPADEEKARETTCVQRPVFSVKGDVTKADVCCGHALSTSLSFSLSVSISLLHFKSRTTLDKLWKRYVKSSQNT